MVSQDDAMKEERVTQVYAPGCALMLYEPQLAERVMAHLATAGDATRVHLTCCRHEPGRDPGSVVINTCAGCDRRYRELHEGISTVSLWEVLASSDSFASPITGASR
jgi:hypothetical protein